MLSKQQSKLYNEQLQIAINTLSELQNMLTVASAAPTTTVTHDLILIHLNKASHELSTLFDNVFSDTPTFKFSDFQKVASDLLKQNKKKRATESTHFALSQYFEGVSQEAVHLAASQAWNNYKSRNSYGNYLRLKRAAAKNKLTVCR